MWTLLSGAALGAQALIVMPAGDPIPGIRADLEVVTWDELGPSREAPELRFGAEILPLTAGEEAGVWRGTWKPPLDGPGHVVLTVTLADGTRSPQEVKLGALPAPTWAPPERVDGRAGGGPVRVRFEGVESPERVSVFVPEGTVESVTATEGGVEVLWQPAPDRAARVVPIGVLDDRRPTAAPAWTVAHLTAHPLISLSTEAGASVTLMVGDRTYGPVIADASGGVTLKPDVFPGETRGEARLVDDLGNMRRVSVTLSEEPGPTLVAAPTGPAEQGRLPPPVHLFAVDRAGNPWLPTPRCRSSAVDQIDVVSTGAGRWLAAPSAADPGALLDLRLDCVSDGDGQQASRSVRLPLAAGRPARLVLRVFPTELSADMPFAQVQAHVEDALGERLAPENLVLSADRGRLESVETSGTLVRAEYIGEGIGLSDQVRASLPVELVGGAEGSPWELEVVGAGDTLQVRALDRRGRGLVGVPVEGTIGSPELQSFAGETDGSGWLSVALSASDEPRVVDARSGDVTRRVALLPWVTAERALDAPALAETVAVQVRAGRVREVQISAVPSLLYTGAGETAVIRVKLLDRAGIPVIDEQMSIEASDGSVGPTRVLADGTLEAIYQPPGGLAYGSVIVSASGEDGAFTAATNLELQPEPINRSVAVMGGYISTLGEISSPYVGLDFDWRLSLKVDGFMLRMTLGGWRDIAEFTDDNTGQTVSSQLTNLLLSPALGYRRELGIWSAWGGLGATLSPYRVIGVYPTGDKAEKVWIHTPGLSTFVGLGRRTLGGEILVELRGVGVRANGSGGFGYTGQVGGLALLAGYRVLY